MKTKLKYLNLPDATMEALRGTLRELKLTPTPELIELIEIEAATLLLPLVSEENLFSLDARTAALRKERRRLEVEEARKKQADGQPQLTPNIETPKVSTVQSTIEGS